MSDRAIYPSIWSQRCFLSLFPFLSTLIGEESWKEIALDLEVRKLNTFCYLFIMMGSATRLFIYLIFHPSLRKCRCRCSDNARDCEDSDDGLSSSDSCPQHQVISLRNRLDFSSSASLRTTQSSSIPASDEMTFTTTNPRMFHLAQSSFKGKNLIRCEIFGNKFLCKSSAPLSHHSQQQESRFSCV